MSNEQQKPQRDQQQQQNNPRPNPQQGGQNKPGQQQQGGQNKPGEQHGGQKPGQGGQQSAAAWIAKAPVAATSLYLPAAAVRVAGCRLFCVKPVLRWRGDFFFAAKGLCLRHGQHAAAVPSLRRSA